MSTSSPPTRVRYAILSLLCVLAMVTYMDRAANGSAKRAIMAELNENQLSTGQKPYDEEDFFIVLMAFQIAYAIFEVPSGWLGDTRGPRATLTRVVLWWSLFVALTGFTGRTLPGGFYVGFTALVVIQFLFGVGESGAFPNISKALYNWFPATSRGFAKSAIWMAARLMGGLTPLVWVLLVEFGGLSWNQALWLFAAVAAVWCVVFLISFTNKPEEHRRVSGVELAAIDAGRAPQEGYAGVPWGVLLRSRNLWAVCFMYVVTNFCWYFLMYNLPGRMKDAYKDWNATDGGKMLLALLSGAPLLVGMVGCLIGGALSDQYIRRTGDRKWGRRLLGMIGYAGAGFCYLIAAAVSWYWPDALWPFAIMLMLMGFFNDLMMAPAWAVCQDIGQRYAATVSGTMNMFGNLVGAVSGIFFTGMVMTSDLGQSQKILVCFATYAAVYFVGVGLWMLIDASKPIAAPAQVHAEEA